MLVNESISRLRWPTLTHKMIKIKENSLICATVKPALNQFFLEYHNNHIIVITIMGLPIRIKNDKITMGRIYIQILSKVICVQKSTKNMTIKKSLNPFILELIWNL